MYPNLHPNTYPDPGLSRSTDAAPIDQRRVRWPGVIIFVVVANAAMWLGTLPFWLSPEGLGMPGAQLILVALMAIPALSSLLVCRVVERRSWLRGTAIRSPGPIPKILGFMAIGFGLVVLALGAGLVLSDLAGLGQLDLRHLSGVVGYERSLPVSARGLPAPAVLLGLELIQAVVASFTINALTALGEETGWRGYLLTALLPLGRPAAIVLSGVVWGLWHLPLILLGYEYPGAHRPVAVLAFLGFTIAVGALLSWLRLRSGSVLPCAVAHGTVNAFAGLGPLLLNAGAPRHVLLGGGEGLVTILCFAVLAAILLAVSPQDARRPAPRR